MTYGAHPSLREKRKASRRLGDLTLPPQTLYFPLQLLQPGKHGIWIGWLPNAQDCGSERVQAGIHAGKAFFHATIHAGIQTVDALPILLQVLFQSVEPQAQGFHTGSDDAFQQFTQTVNGFIDIHTGEFSRIVPRRQFGSA